MTLLECFIRDSVFLDVGGDVVYSEDAIIAERPERFPTVEGKLISTVFLTDVADRIRIERGMRPFYPRDDWSEGDCDHTGWYDFYLTIWQRKDGIGAQLAFVVDNTDSMDEGKLYEVDLTEDEQITLYNRLDEQTRRYLGKSCEELLQEAKKEMEDEGH